MWTPRPVDPGSEGAKGRPGKEDHGGTVAPELWALAVATAGCSGLPGLRQRSPTAGKGNLEPPAADGVSCPGLGGQGQGLVKARHQASRKSPRVRPTTHRKVLLGERSGDPSRVLDTRTALVPSPAHPEGLGARSPSPSVVVPPWLGLRPGVTRKSRKAHVLHLAAPLVSGCASPFQVCS